MGLPEADSLFLTDQFVHSKHATELRQSRWKWERILGTRMRNAVTFGKSSFCVNKSLICVNVTFIGSWWRCGCALASHQVIRDRLRSSPLRLFCCLYLNLTPTVGIKFAFLYQLLLPNYLTTIHHVNAGMLSLFGEQGINTKVIARHRRRRACENCSRGTNNHPPKKVC